MNSEFYSISILDLKSTLFNNKVVDKDSVFYCTTWWIFGLVYRGSCECARAPRHAPSRPHRYPDNKPEPAAADKRAPSFREFLPWLCPLVLLPVRSLVVSSELFTLIISFKRLVIDLGSILNSSRKFAFTLWLASRQDDVSMYTVTERSCSF